MGGATRVLGGGVDQAGYGFMPDSALNTHHLLDKCAAGTVRHLYAGVHILTHKIIWLLTTCQAVLHLPMVTRSALDLSFDTHPEYVFYTDSLSITYSLYTPKSRYEEGLLSRFDYMS